MIFHHFTDMYGTKFINKILILACPMNSKDLHFFYIENLLSFQPEHTHTKYNYLTIYAVSLNICMRRRKMEVI
jgi:hypothetical protein